MIAQQSVQPDLPDTSTGPSFQPAFVRAVPALHRAVAVRRNCWHFFHCNFILFYPLLQCRNIIFNRIIFPLFLIRKLQLLRARFFFPVIRLSCLRFSRLCLRSRRFLCRLLFIQNPCLVIGVTTLALPECSVRSECEDAAYYTI